MLIIYYYLRSIGSFLREPITRITAEIPNTPAFLWNYPCFVYGNCIMQFLETAVADRIEGDKILATSSFRKRYVRTSIL